ncbi:hypothetical protein Clacol_004210 [Clathrus columnatus]|uniref:Alpha-galactosidase n=1 Tax=Clathrus columnatus TaxID=1419009 RepID=A0AAV5AB91_9AGAM|nr:hypothetical protein Clacol_004210 [Clathrus columnatus]
MGAAQAMINNGLDKLGYECWQAPARDPSTNAPLPDPQKFPNGLKSLADKIHGMGLKFGLYSDAGLSTCGGRFGSLGFEEIDAQTYASWGVDYLKYDNCYNEGRAGTPQISFERYNNMSQALNATGRHILYSMCNWGEDGPWNFAVTIANSWHCAMARIIDFAAPVGQKAGPGRWNDLDMLEIGNGGMNTDEYITHFTMWSLLKSPLILGNDVTNMTNETLTIITNDALISVNQDSAGSPANRIWKQPASGGGDLSLWQGSLANNPNTQTVDILMSDAFIDQGSVYQAQPYELFDLWQKNSTGSWGKSIGTVQGKIPNVKIGPHQTKVWKAIPQ